MADDVGLQRDVTMGSDYRPRTLHLKLLRKQWQILALQIIATVALVGMYLEVEPLDGLLACGSLVAELQGTHRPHYPVLRGEERHAPGVIGEQSDYVGVLAASQSFVVDDRIGRSARRIPRLLLWRRRVLLAWREGLLAGVCGAPTTAGCPVCPVGLVGPRTLHTSALA